mmetsp:Transcript_26124/g.104517  ORF Transcript_26124/g.104517 Transcript_26124/m.104517 type:complete len:801 (-) Transcript_26124:22-2424(-)
MSSSRGAARQLRTTEPRAVSLLVPHGPVSHLVIVEAGLVEVAEEGVLVVVDVVRVGGPTGRRCALRGGRGGRPRADEGGEEGVVVVGAPERRRRVFVVVVEERVAATRGARVEERVELLVEVDAVDAPAPRRRRAPPAVVEDRRGGAAEERVVVVVVVVEQVAARDARVLCVGRRRPPPVPEVGVEDDGQDVERVEAAQQELLVEREERVERAAFGLGEVGVVVFEDQEQRIFGIVIVRRVEVRAVEHGEAVDGALDDGPVVDGIGDAEPRGGRRRQADVGRDEVGPPRGRQRRRRAGRDADQVRRNQRRRTTTTRRGPVVITVPTGQRRDEGLELVGGERVDAAVGLEHDALVRGSLRHARRHRRVVRAVVKPQRLVVLRVRAEEVVEVVDVLLAQAHGLVDLLVFAAQAPSSVGAEVVVVVVVVLQGVDEPVGFESAERRLDRRVRRVGRAVVLVVVLLGPLVDEFAVLARRRPEGLEAGPHVDERLDQSVVLGVGGLGREEPLEAAPLSAVLGELGRQDLDRRQCLGDPRFERAGVSDSVEPPRQPRGERVVRSVVCSRETGVRPEGDGDAAARGIGQRRRGGRRRPKERHGGVVGARGGQRQNAVEPEEVRQAPLRRVGLALGDPALFVELAPEQAVPPRVLVLLDALRRDAPRRAEPREFQGLLGRRHHFERVAVVGGHLEERRLQRVFGGIFPLLEGWGWSPREALGLDDRRGPRRRRRRGSSRRPLLLLPFVGRLGLGPLREAEQPARRAALGTQRLLRREPRRGPARQRLDARHQEPARQHHRRRPRRTPRA